jgi:hypothetical protein
VNREGTLHIVRVSHVASRMSASDKFRVGFADYQSPGGALKTKEIAGEAALRQLLRTVGIDAHIVESAFTGLRSEGSASILRVVLSDESLIRLGLQDVRLGKDMVDFGVRLLKSQGRSVVAVVREDGTMWFEVDRKMLISWNQMHDIALGKYTLGTLEEEFKRQQSRQQQTFSVRFTVFNQVDGPVLSYAIAGPFMPATFSSHGPKFRDTAHLVESLDRVGLPGKEIAGLSDRVYNVTGAQLHSLGLKLPDEQQR